jgi:hypothetical protein
VEVDVEVAVGDRVALDLLKEGKRLLGLVLPAELDEQRRGRRRT